jgi:DNA-binding transcriptional MerR regulator
VRYYVQRGLLPAPVFRGRDTVYGREHLVRLQAIRRLQEQFLPLDVIQQTLAGAAPDALQTLAAGQEVVPATAGLSIHASQSSPATPQPESAPQAQVGERWQRWVLAPGLELHLSETADAATRQQAEALLVAFRQRATEGLP